MSSLSRAPLALLAASLVSCGARPPPSAPASRPPAAPVAAAPGATAPAPAPPPAALAPPQPALRLPRNFEPTRYTARLAIDPARDDFDGAIAIAGTVTERSAVIWLHGEGLTVARAAAQRDGAEVPLAVTPRGQDLLELRAAAPLDPGAWTLALDYRGQLDLVNTAGAFKQTVAERAYVYTQLEAIFARRVFPCIDEPDRKVPWKLTLDVPRELTAVANAPITAEAPLDARTKRVEFAATRPLPSYLVAFGVGPFDVVDAGATRRGTPVRIVASARRGAEAAYAARTAARILELAEDWFGTPYPYEKLDLLAIPITVGFGAMENAGLITYSETLILMDPARPPVARQHRWGATAAHEIAHQWFGNLVTPAFWDDVWLSEGFAEWVQSKIAAQLEPAWRDPEAALEVRDRALASDALVSARQIRQPIESTDDILTAFDRITYDKGASVLAMFEQYVGPDVFQRGVRDYLAARAWGNATSDDFIAAIAKAAGPRLAALGAAPDAAAGERLVAAGLTSLIAQPGAPEVTATLACDGGRARLELAQRRYVPPGAPAPPAGKPWTLPVCAAYERGGARAEACAMLDRATGALELPTAGGACPRWVMPNAGGRGYYRSAYTAAQVAALRDEAWEQLSWAERRALYSEVAQAATRGRMPLPVALSLVPRLLAGADRFTVGPALELAIGLDRVVPDGLRQKYELYLRQTFGPGALAAGFLGKDSDTLDVEETREDLLRAVGWFGRDPGIASAAARLVERGWRDLPPAIRGVALELGADARPELFERLLREVRAEPDRVRRREVYAALASVRDPDRQRRALGLVIDPKVDIRETLWMLFGGRSPAALAVAQQFFREHAAAILARAPSSETTGQLAQLSRLFTATCRADQRDAVIEYVRQTFERLPGGARVVRQGIEAMDQCIASRQLLEPEVTAWLTGLRPPKPPGAAKASGGKPGKAGKGGGGKGGGGKGGGGKGGGGKPGARR